MFEAVQGNVKGVVNMKELMEELEVFRKKWSAAYDMTDALRWFEDCVQNFDASEQLLPLTFSDQGPNMLMLSHDSESNKCEVFSQSRGRNTYLEQGHTPIPREVVAKSSKYFAHKKTCLS